MSVCLYPAHHAKSKGGLTVLAVLAVCGYVGFLHVRHTLAHFADNLVSWLVLGLVVLVPVVVVALVVALVVCNRRGIKVAWRSKRLSFPKFVRHVPRTLWAMVSWRWVSRNLGLSAPDKHRPGKVRRPKARIWPHKHGVAMRIKTKPGAGRVEVEAVAQALADHLRVARVSVTQPRPHILRVRALKNDPLLEKLVLADAPAFDLSRPHRVWLGRDEHGADRFADLANISGILLGGTPGAGKSQCLTSWLTQLAPSPAVQMVLCDGKGAEEFSDLDPRAWISCGDSIDRILDVLDQLTTLMYERLATVRDFTGGKKNIWDVGVSAAWPMIFSVFDETQSWADMPAAKAIGKDQEKACGQAVKLASELVRKGRSTGFVNVFSSQKPTSDSVPSTISSNCALSVAFSVKTSDAAKSVLGPDIGEYPLLSPVGLSLPEHAGVCVVSLRDGLAPFTRLRSPMVTEDQSAAVVAATAHLRRDPRVTITVPDDTAAELVSA